MQYDPYLTVATKKFFEKIGSQPQPQKLLWDMSESEFIKARPSMVENFAKLSGQPDFSIDVEDIQIQLNGNTIGVRVLTPPSNKTISPMPTIVYYPGGGFVMDLGVQWIPCTKIAKHTGCKVFIIKCSLAPENKFPKGINEAFAGMTYLYDNAEKFNIDRRRMIIAGDSSGGNFAAVVTNRLKKTRPDIKLYLQILISPNVDQSLETYRNNPFKLYQEADIMVREEGIEYCRNLYILAGANLKDVDISPLFCDLTGLPPTIITCAQYDGVRGDVEAYYLKLKNSGNDVEKIIWPGHVHNSMICRGVFDDGIDPTDLIGEAISLRLLEVPL